ncbi:DnaT-like ssDNA-binding protein [Marinobacter sp. W-8]|uniref:DnaT-like ssDNA-binding protein n=1 Tax=Marinobacter sp. W-8 TaxID=3369658 RepID=UPI0037CB4A13
MINYVTVSDVDTYAQNVADWTSLDTDTKDKHVYTANIYLNNKKLVVIDADNIPDQVVRAGCELALIDMSDGIYKADTPDVTSESVKLGSLAVSTSYSNNTSDNSAQLNFVDALLKPYIPSGNVFSLNRGW